ncbi:MAG TPA: RAD55 family ATPase, partial [Longimicrobium sp.]|nr:RAD55 family ATPase [Longimicrobium sp.]
LPNEQEFRFALAHVCDRVNEMFFGHAHPSHSVLAARGATLGTAFLVHEITALLTAVSARSTLPASHAEALPLAMGLYLFLRLRRLVRFRYQFLPDMPDPDEEHERAPQGPPLVARAAHRRQCVSMLRPLEYTFLQTAIFGIQTGIQGLNFVLRGGLLPRREAGRTFVITGPAGCGKTLLGLQLLCDIASKGGLGVYCSFEEDYDSIAERLVTFDLLRPTFRILLGSEGPLEKLRGEAHHPCGTLLFYKLEAGATTGVGAIMAELAAATRYTQRALVLDSLNALTWAESASADDLRQMLYGVIRAVEKEHFFGFLLSEADDPRLSVVPYIADTLIELAPASKGRMRRMEVSKCRTQDYHRGPHPYHLAERKGVVVYPSLGAVRDTIRRRVSATLSEHRAIRLPPVLGEALGVERIEEKSSVLVSGVPEASVLLFALQLLTEAPHASARAEARAPAREKANVNSVLVVTFNTPEVRFNQMLRRHAELSRRWSGIVQTQLRWYSPGGSLTGDQILAELRQYILRGRRYGSPIERVLFYEVELAEQLLPSLATERLFWPTVLQLLNTEAVTALFVVGEVSSLHPTTLAAIEAEVDYSFHFSHTPPANGRGAPGAAYAPDAVEADDLERPAYSATGYVQTCRVPRLVPDLVGRYAPVQVTRNGLIE